MPLNIRSDEVNRLAEELAVRKRITKTEAVKVALQNELLRLEEAIPLWERVAPLRRRLAARPDTGLEADKAFFDELSGEV
ncbi:MAG TPA: type II toxin-antitoxin system VapB family antitoxin [Roseiarcus sp.]|nr:type II toxin-antitoxin system VapB family antitoxin [Roseiarcus sp.]